MSRLVSSSSYSEKHIDLLRQRLGQWKRLLGLLKQESEALETHDAASLINITEEKTKILDAIHAVESSSNVKVQTNGSGKAGDSLFSGKGVNEEDLELNDLLESLYAVENECMRVNRHNQILNLRGRQRLEQVLALMRGEPTEPVTYDHLASKTPGASQLK